MPFAGYSNFDECVRKNKDKNDPEAYCATIMRQVEGKVFHGPMVVDSLHGMKAIVETNSKTGKKDYYVEGYIMTHGRDLGGDDITENCMLKAVEQIRSEGLKIDVEHDNIADGSKEGLNRLHFGQVVPETAKYDGKGIWARVKMFKSHPGFKTVWKAVQEGILDAFSIGYQVLKGGAFKKVKDGVKTRMLDSIRLLNATLTGLPMQPGAKMTSFFMKSLDRLEADGYLTPLEQNNSMGDNQGILGSAKEHISKEQPLSDAEQKAVFSLIEKSISSDGKSVHDKDMEDTMEDEKKPEQNETKNEETEETKDTESNEAENSETNQESQESESKALDPIRAEVKTLSGKLDEAESKSVELEKKTTELDKELSALKKTFKEFLNAPQRKGAQEDMKAKTATKTAEIKGPMDIIR